MNKKRYALISVYNKDKIEILCKLFKENNISIISTGNTYQHIKNNGYKCLKVEKFTTIKGDSPFIDSEFIFDKTQDDFKELEDMLPNYCEWLKLKGNEKYGY